MPHSRATLYLIYIGPVSYTHLDVYKRQLYTRVAFCSVGQQGIDYEQLLVVVFECHDTFRMLIIHIIEHQYFSLK